MQRFDPGFGFNSGGYAIQPLYSPAVNYNTEFPQLGSGHRPPVPIDHHPRAIPQHLRGPWSAASSAVGYGHPEGVMGPFGPNQVSAHAMPSIYMHSQYSVPRPGIPFVQSHEHLQPFSQVCTAL